MNYHNIQHDDMLNGMGLRVTLFVSGCNNYCAGCQNPQTWDIHSGIPFTEDDFNELANLIVAYGLYTKYDSIRENAVKEFMKEPEWEAIQEKYQEVLRYESVE